MAKPNYEFAKRQRDLLKKQKKEAKKLKKAAAAGEGDNGNTEVEASDVETTATEGTPAAAVDVKP